MKRAFTTFFSLVTLTFFMAGCSSVRLIETDVTAFPKWNTAPPGPGTAYRFERLPSQQAPEAQQNAIEALATTALAKVGMVLNPSLARYSVQVVLNRQSVDRQPYYGGGYGGYGGFGGYGLGSPGVFLGAGNMGGSMGLSFPMQLSAPYLKRDLTILMRELRTTQVVFESRALHDGVGRDDLIVLPAMLDSALRGFPEPPPGTRRINVEIPR